MKQAKDIIRALFDEAHAQQAENYASLFNGWKTVAGDDIAAHSRVVDIQDGTVLVEADHPGWLQMIRLRERSIVEALKRKYPPLSIMRLRVRTAVSNSARTGGAGSEATNIDVPLPEVERLRDRDSAEYQEFKKLLDRVNNLGENGRVRK